MGAVPPARTGGGHRSPKIERNRMKKSERKIQKRREAEERQAYWSSLSTDEKLKRLATRRGNSKKQRERLMQDK